MSSPWLTRYGRNPAATARLICFHCAGGSASEFRSWSTHLTGKIELVAVQLPGREGRVKDPFITNLDDLVRGVADAVTPLLDKPYVVFGHSLGAVCGFEVIRELRRRGLKQPFLFVPAGRPGPQTKPKKPPIASLPKEEFIEELRKEYGDHIGHVLDSVELREVFLPQIHADFALSETYRFRVEPPLDCSIAALAGVDEDDLESDALNAWAAHTSRLFSSRRFPGDHFFIRASQRPVIEAIVEAIRVEIVSVRPDRANESRTLLV